ncbi:hypothetical protein MPH_08644 [Macrophomina phaseolina MS6]|uniref:Uncharacterized protein n=1 Tax=Macrophomina phaseolina (strain MS6) TaxID=1126212 RepID=K2QWK4_MACPH|nr:hypothetical protein MPH_08644 [Macrophomina phaseolina MS6]
MKAAPSTTPVPTLSGSTFSHLLQLPRELRDLIWEYSLLAAHPTPAITSPASIAAAYRKYDSWGEELIHYPRSTPINSTALLCCSHQLHNEVRAAIERLRAQRRLVCSLRLLLRNEQYLFLDWTCVPTRSTHYDGVHISVKVLGKPEQPLKHSPSSSGAFTTPVKTLHPSSFSSRAPTTLQAFRAAPQTIPSSSTTTSSLLYARQPDGAGDYTLHRALFKLLARLRTHGPSFLGDPIIFSVISSLSSSLSSPSSSYSHSSTSIPSPAPSPLTTFTTLTFDVLTPPPSHADPATAYRPALFPWEAPSSSPRHSHHRHRPATNGIAPPIVLAVALREFVCWALHGASPARQRGNAFFVEGFVFATRLSLFSPIWTFAVEREGLSHAWGNQLDAGQHGWTDYKRVL